MADAVRKLNSQARILEADYAKVALKGGREGGRRREGREEGEGEGREGKRKGREEEGREMKEGKRRKAWREWREAEGRKLNSQAHTLEADYAKVALKGRGGRKGGC